MLSNGANAQMSSLVDQLPDIQDYFDTPHGDDYSAQLLNQIFGPLFPSPRNASGATLFSTLIGIVNIVVLSIAVVMFLYNTIVAVLQTAHEGIFLGNRYSSLWVPVRILFAIALLVPAPGLGGYNPLQYGMAWLVKGSTVMASEVWQLGASSLISGDVPIVNYGSELDPEIFKVAYRNQLCVKIANYQFGAANSPLRVEFKEVGSSRTTTFISHVDNRREGICGSYSIPEIPDYIANLPPEFSQSIGNEFKGLHREVLNTLVTSINDILDDQWQVFANQSQGLNDFSSSIRATLVDINQQLSEGNQRINQLITGSSLQDGSARRVIGDYISGTGCNSGPSGLGKTANCNGEGWIGAGNWYMTIARLNSEAVGLVKASVGATATQYISNENNSLNRLVVGEVDNVGSWRRLLGSVDDNKYLHRQETRRIWDAFTGELERSTLNLAVSGFNIPTALMEATATKGEGGFLGKIWRVGFAGGVEAMIANLSPSRWADDPIVGIVNIGHWYLDAAGTLMLGSAAASLFAGSISTTVTFLIAAPLAVIGITLSFILPLLPFFLWILAVAGYFLLLVEATVGSTLWLLSHLRLDGEGLSGSHGQRGWIMLLGLILTPPLMVMGYFAGMMLFKITTTLLDTGFYFAMTALVNGSPIVGIFGLIATGFLLVVAYIAIIERSFSLVAEFPNRVLAWIGGDVDLAISGEYKRIQSGGQMLSSFVRSGIGQLGSKMTGGSRMLKSGLSSLSKSK